jgi:hypothetical protein
MPTVADPAGWWDDTTNNAASALTLTAAGIRIVRVLVKADYGRSETSWEISELPLCAQISRAFFGWPCPLSNEGEI